MAIVAQLHAGTCACTRTRTRNDSRNGKAAHHSVPANAGTQGARAPHRRPGLLPPQEHVEGLASAPYLSFFHNRHSREGGNPASDRTYKSKRTRWIPAFAGMTKVKNTP